MIDDMTAPLLVSCAGIRRLPCQDFHVNLPSPKGAVHPKQLYSLTRGNGTPNRTLVRWESVEAVDSGVRCGSRYQRLKALLMIDDRTGVVWVEEQATNVNLAPSFPTLVLIELVGVCGLTRGWLMVHSWENRYKERGEEVTRRVFELRRI